MEWEVEGMLGDLVWRELRREDADIDPETGRETTVRVSSRHLNKQPLSLKLHILRDTTNSACFPRKIDKKNRETNLKSSRNRLNIPKYVHIREYIKMKRY